MLGLTVSRSLRIFWKVMTMNSAHAAKTHSSGDTGKGSRSWAVPHELLTASDAMIEDVINYADPMVLRGLLYQLTEDEEILEMELATQAFANFYVNCLANASDVARLRTKAAGLLKAYRDREAGEIPLGPPQRLYRSLSLTAGSELPESEREMWLEQTALDPWARALKWKAHPPAPEARAQFTVAIIGTGLSGLNAAVQLKHAGIPFIALEKNPEVGGTWFENRYLGARVDSPSRSYSHLFGVDFPYPYSFCPRDENLRYMRWVADTFALRADIVFNTEVRSVVWDEGAHVWEITADDLSGRRSWRVNAVVSCVGFLSRPKMPEIPGIQSFEGISCHTARWPSELDLAGKRAAVIGSGASGYQTTPEIAKIAAHTYLFQRTASWCFANSSYVRPLRNQSLWLDRNFPFYTNFVRFRLSWMYGPENIRAATRIDPRFEHPHARSEANHRSREELVEFVHRKLAGHPELIEKMIPKAPPMSSRPVMIDAEDSIFEALVRDNFTLVSEPIERVTPTGIRAGGVDYPLDAIIYATGFRANEFLWPMEVRGRNGVKVEDLWAKDGPRAYIGAMLPGFPNFFMAYGPNTNNFGGFQVIDLLEIEIRFALSCIAGLIEQQKRSVEVTSEAYWRFNEELDLEERMMIYMDPRAHNYYQSEYGRSCANGPIDFRRMWHWLRDPAGPECDEADPILRPHFGGDLIVS
jgi:4-hydroxyacetophenone monooxygenase